MIQPHEIIATVSILEYNEGTDKSPDWQPSIIDAVDLGWLTKKPEDFNKKHRPIPLTEKILVEWCGFEKWKDNIFRKSWGRNGVHFITIFPDELFYFETGNNTHRHIETLHHLQMLVQSLTNQPLKITLK